MMYQMFSSTNIPQSNEFCCCGIESTRIVGTWLSNGRRDRETEWNDLDQGETLPEMDDLCQMAECYPGSCRA